MDIDHHHPPAPPTAPDGTVQRELFVVQRCWHSGPHQYQPLDMMRLFLTQRDAEEAAYHSAHAWCRYHKPNAEPQVKTLLLPSYPAHNTSGSSYGFIAYGSLFWVRSLFATTNATCVSNDPRDIAANEAFAVVTEGVIGGTGNRMSRRGTEASHGRVFLPEATVRTMMMSMLVNSHAANEVMRRKALEMCHYVMAQIGTHVSTNVVAVPIGRPSEYTSGNFLKDWPPQVLQPSLLESTLQGYNNEHKRTSQSIMAFDGDMRSVSTTEDDHPQQDYFDIMNSSDDMGIVVDCPFALPAAKRRRFCDDNDASPVIFSAPTSIPFTEDDVMMISSYGVAGEQA